MNKEQFKHYVIGIPQLDREHWGLFQLLTKVQEAIVKGNSGVAKKTLDKFFVRLDEHCAHEEEIMRNCNYPYVDQHTASHPEATSQLGARRDIIVDNILYLDVGTMIDLLSNHIDYSDRHITAFYIKEIKDDTK